VREMAAQDSSERRAEEVWARGACGNGRPWENGWEGRDMACGAATWTKPAETRAWSLRGLHRGTAETLGIG
jgi:hypothetical protein